MNRTSAIYAVEACNDRSSDLSWTKAGFVFLTPRFSMRKIGPSWLLICCFPLSDKRLVPTAPLLALPTLNNDCEAHSRRRIKRYRPDLRGNVFLYDVRLILYKLYIM